MSILVIAEHDNNQLKPETAKVVQAASQLSGDIHVLVAGEGCKAVAEQAAALSGVSLVKCADSTHYAHQMAESVSALVVSLAADYSHILTAATTTGKNFMPRVAALLDVAQISDITGIEADNRFIRPVYAGNAIATVESEETVHVITV